MPWLPDSVLSWPPTLPSLRAILLSLPLLLGCLALQTRPATQPATGEFRSGRVFEVLAYGDERGQFVLPIYRAAGADAARGPQTTVMFRPLGAGPDGYVQYAQFDARVLAAAGRAGDLAVLVETAQSGPGRTQVRFVYNPLAAGQSPQELPGPSLPGGADAFDLAGDGGAGEETGKTPLYALARAGDGPSVVYELAGDAWRELPTLPEDLATLPENALSLGTAAGRPVVAGRGGATIRVAHLSRDGAAWGEAMTLDIRDGERFEAVDARGVAEPLVYLWGESDRLARAEADGPPTVVTVAGFVPPAGSDATVAATDPRTAATATGTLRLIRASPRYDDQSALIELPLDARTLEAVGGTAVITGDAAGAEQVRRNLLELLLLALLVVAVATTLRQRPLPPAETLRDVAANLAPLGLRLAAGLVDLLPLVVTGGFYYAAHGRLSDAGEWVVLGSGVIVYMAHLIAAEATTGRSLGKAMFGLRVVRTDGGTPSLWAIFLRNVLRPLDAATGGLTLALVPMSPLRQRLGDLAAATTVVQTRREDGNGDAPGPD